MLTFNWTEYFNIAMGRNERWGVPNGSIPAENDIIVRKGRVYPPLLLGRMKIPMIPNDWIMGHCTFAKKKKTDCPHRSNSTINCYSCPIRPENSPKGTITR